jgi:hypothetical protein
MTKETEWAARVDAWRGSRIRAAEFCKDQEYSATTLYWWSSRLRRSAESAEQGKRARLSPPVRRAGELPAPRPVQLARIVRQATASAGPSVAPVIVQIGQIRVEVPYPIRQRRLALGQSWRVGCVLEADVAGRMDKQGRRWGADEAREVLRQWRASGQSASAFAGDRGFSAMRLSYWAKRLSSETPVRFVSVPLAEESARDTKYVAAHGGV